MHWLAELAGIDNAEILETEVGRMALLFTAHGVHLAGVRVSVRDYLALAPVERHALETAGAAVYGLIDYRDSGQQAEALLETVMAVSLG